jgi:hypothetical protein
MWLISYRTPILIVTLLTKIKILNLYHLKLLKAGCFNPCMFKIS